MELERRRAGLASAPIPNVLLQIRGNFSAIGGKLRHDLLVQPDVHGR
jgi:hypothetical protein